MSNKCSNNVQTMFKKWRKHTHIKNKVSTRCQHFAKMTCTKHVLNTSKTCPKHVQHRSRTCPSISQNISKQCTTHVQNMSKACTKHVQNMLDQALSKKNKSLQIKKIDNVFLPWLLTMAAAGSYQWHWDTLSESWAGGDNWHTKATRLDLKSQFFAHGTSVANALKICLDGFCKPSTWKTCDAIAGSPGVYFFQLKSLSEADVAEAWKRTRNGGYKKGAMLICRMTCSPSHRSRPQQKKTKLL